MHASEARLGGSTGTAALARGKSQFHDETTNFPPIARGTTSSYSLAYMKESDINIGTTGTRRPRHGTGGILRRTSVGESSLVTGRYSEIFTGCSCYQNMMSKRFVSQTAFLFR